jgi:uncharacterized lipoprotein YmbA
MASRMIHLTSIAFVAVAAAGCGASAPSRFYTLSSTATATDAPTAQYAVLVGPVSIPAAVDRPQFVVQVAPNRVELDEFSRWAAPLDDAIARAVAGDLAVLLGTRDVAAAPAVNFNPAYRVTIDVQSFESILGEAVVIDALWTVHTTAGGKTQSGRTTVREPVQGTGFDALAAAHSRALANVSADIAAVIRAAAESIRAPEERSRAGAKKRQ